MVNGDVLTDLDVGALWDFHHERGAEGTIALTPVDDPSRYGVVPIDDDGRVEAFVEKPPPGEAPTNWINAGTYVLEPSVLDRIPAGRKVSIERETFPAMVADGSLYALQSRRLLGRRRHAGDLPAGAARPDRRASAARPSAAVAPDRAVDRRGAAVEHSVLMAGVDRRGRRDGRATRSCCPAPASAPGAVVDGSIVGARARGRRRRAARRR